MPRAEAEGKEWPLLPVLYHGLHGAGRNKEGLEEHMVT